MVHSSVWVAHLAFGTANQPMETRSSAKATSAHVGSYNLVALIMNFMEPIVEVYHWWSVWPRWTETNMVQEASHSSGCVALIRGVFLSSPGMFGPYFLWWKARLASVFLSTAQTGSARTGVILLGRLQSPVSYIVFGIHAICDVINCCLTSLCELKMSPY